MANPNRDAVSVVFDDVLSAKRQSEIAEIVERLARFNPTTVALEERDQTVLDERYRAFRDGVLELDRSEREQLGFRVAATLNHARIFAVDADAPTLVQEGELEDEPALRDVLADVRADVARHQAMLNEGSILDLLRALNTDEATADALRPYVDGFLRIEGRSGYLGADATAAWYHRNLRIFSNLVQLSLPDDRVLCIIGSGHVPILRHLATASAQFIVTDATRYLT